VSSCSCQVSFVEYLVNVAWVLYKNSHRALFHYTVLNDRVQVSSGVLYSVDFHTTGQHRTLLIVSGDEGILGFDWNAILKGNTTTLFRCKPHYSLSTVEINDFFHYQKIHIRGRRGCQWIQVGLGNEQANCHVSFC
jgi:hypothetical protein